MMRVIPWAKNCKCGACYTGTGYVGVVQNLAGAKLMASRYFPC
jgi:hypothetical protein